MTQPSEQPPLLARRVGPFSVLIWFLLFVGLIALVLWWRKRTSGNANTAANSAVDLSAGVTQTAPTMIPYTSDIFVTVKNPVTGTEPPPSTPSEPPPNVPPTTTPPPPPKQTSVTYPIVSGDTLSAIGQRFGVPWQSIYQANKSVIEARAQQQGLSSSNGGHWIFPGTTLMIPV